jgi:hypothetical protein
VSDYPAITIKDAGDELNRLHGEIESKMRSTVADAIRAGEILATVKESLRHGDFLPWIKANCKFGTTTAEKYQKVFEYQSKIASSVNLQEAYRQVETLEAQSRQSESQKAAQRVAEYKKTGVKPEGWRRGTDDNLYNEEIARDARIKKMQESIREEDAKRQSQYQAKAEPSPDFDDIFKSMGTIVEDAKKRLEFKDKIRVSHEGQSDQFIDALMDYLNELTDDSRRIEACYNIIKVCKGIANQLQAGK